MTILHLDSPNINSLPHLLYASLIYIYIYFFLSSFLNSLRVSYGHDFPLPKCDAHFQKTKTFSCITTVQLSRSGDFFFVGGRHATWLLEILTRD